MHIKLVEKSFDFCGGILTKQKMNGFYIFIVSSCREESCLFTKKESEPITWRHFEVVSSLRRDMLLSERGSTKIAENLSSER